MNFAYAKAVGTSWNENVCHYQFRQFYQLQFNTDATSAVNTKMSPKCAFPYLRYTEYFVKIKSSTCLSNCCVVWEIYHNTFQFQEI